MTISELKDRFLAIKKIKKGGQKIVYKAVCPNGKFVALKIISNLTDKRVLQEISVVKSLCFSFTPKILESGTVIDESIHEEVLYIIEEFVQGISLRDWINNHNTADLKFAYSLLRSLLLYEIELEKHNILHRDINPNNIILGENDQIYLIDFGLAKIIGGTSLTQTTAMHGPFTPGYAPHEQFANIKLQQDVRTDLFQIGVTVYECCMGRNPFVEANSTVYQIMERTIEVIPPVLMLVGDNKKQFAQLISMMMAKNQSQRPDSASDAMRYLKMIRPTLSMEE